MYGYGWIADRPEFPEDWDLEHILQVSKEVCKQADSFHVAQEMTVDGCDMVVVFGKKGRIASIYPKEVGYYDRRKNS